MQTVTPDTNILISALLWGGKPLQLIERAIAGEIRLVISDAILNETLRVIREKFHLPEDRVTRAKEYIEGCTERIAVAQTLNVMKEDADDDRIQECASASGADVIVTGDNDLLRLGSYEGIAIVRVSDFLERGREG